MTAQLVIHGDRYAGRAAGPPATLAMRRETDPVEVARQARGLLLSGTWRTVPKTGGDLAKAEYLVRVKLPQALALFPRPALHALTRRHPEPGCRWDNLAYFAALALQPEPAPSEALLALLGPPCRRCAARLVGQVLDAVTAGLPPARPCRRCKGAHRWRPAAITASAGSSTGLAPTGMLWPAGERPPAAALRAAALPRPTACRRPLQGWTAAALRRAVSRRPAP